MVVNDTASNQMPNGVFGFLASRARSYKIGEVIKTT